MKKSLLIVEDKNDEAFFNAIIKHIELQEQIDVTEAISFEYRHIAAEPNPEKPTALINELKSLKNDFAKEKYGKVGIIRDMDNRSTESQLQLINKALKTAYDLSADVCSDENTLNSISIASANNPQEISFACHFIGLPNEANQKQGEIENILKAIKTQPSPIADCFDKNIAQCHPTISKKDALKLWFNNYHRYDQPPKLDASSTSMAGIMARHNNLFDFDSPILADLKKFIRLFNCE